MTTELPESSKSNSASSSEIASSSDFWESSSWKKEFESKGSRRWRKGSWTRRRRNGKQQHLAPSASRPTLSPRSTQSHRSCIPVHLRFELRWSSGDSTSTSSRRSEFSFSPLSFVSVTSLKLLPLLISSRKKSSPTRPDSFEAFLRSVGASLSRRVSLEI